MSIVVVGSSNTDLVVNVPNVPLEGETVLGNKFSTHKGGKGANQAVAAARLGANVIFISCIGKDDFGNKAVKSYQAERINTNYIVREGESSGIALITVSDKGKNAISVSPESNGLLSEKHIDAVGEVLENCEVVLVQLEIPLQTVEYLIKKCIQYDCKVILNPAPALKLEQDIYRYVDIIIPNETEAEILTGIKVTDEKSAKLAAKSLIDKGIKNVIITLGSNGAYLYNQTHQELIPGFEVNPVDTTAAGDTFNGAIAYAITQKKSILDAVKFAHAASALAVTKHGAQSSTPDYKSVVEFLKSYQLRVCS